jgi:hypothetical protein
MVLYTGKKPYRYSADIFDLFEDKDLARRIMFKPFSLIEVWKNSDEEMKQRLSGVLELVLKHVKEPEFIKLVQELGPVWRKVETIMGIAKVARRMLAGGMELSVIAKMTGLSFEVIKKLSLNPL